MTDKAETFAHLHAGPDLLILPNAWDAGSARIIEHAGAKARRFPTSRATTLTFA